MGVEENEISKNSNGGTEIIGRALNKRLREDLTLEVQIIPSRVRELDPTKIRILHLHDLPGDPESDRVLNGEGWQRFHKLVFVSNWQMQAYVHRYNIPWSKCAVIKNAIEPIGYQEKPTDTINLIYHSTPHRGLQILVPVFVELAKEYPEIRLDVYSSFELYGWGDRDAPFKVLFDQIKDHPQMTYWGAVPNGAVREALTSAHIFAYPNVWPETSCLCLIEAMSAGCICVHPNFAALYETAANWTQMYQFHEDVNAHAERFYRETKNAIDLIKAQPGITAGWKNLLEVKMRSQSDYVNAFYDWDVRIMEWEMLIESLLDEPREIVEPRAKFIYSTT